MAGKPKASKKRAAKGSAEARILDAALEIAERDGWGGVRLADVAARAGVDLARLRRHYRDSDAIANAWFQRGLDAMLAPLPSGFHGRPARDRIETLMRRWFDAMAAHRRVTAEMLQAKLWVFHPHHYVPMVFSLSRLIQWLRGTAGLEAGGRRKQVEETGLTALFLMTLAVWCRDDSDNQERTRAFLSARLDQADACMGRFCRTHSSDTKG